MFWKRECVKRGREGRRTDRENENNYTAKNTIIYFKRNKQECNIVNSNEMKLRYKRGGVEEQRVKFEGSFRACADENKIN